jgi:hypothetical protein
MHVMHDRSSTIPFVNRRHAVWCARENNITRMHFHQCADKRHDAGHGKIISESVAHLATLTIHRKCEVQRIEWGEAVQRMEIRDASAWRKPLEIVHGSPLSRKACCVSRAVKIQPHSRSGQMCQRIALGDMSATRSHINTSSVS